jgi:hypothetical protein
MTPEERFERVAHLNWARRLGPPTLQWSEAEPGVTISNCLELDQALHKITGHRCSRHAIIATLYGHGSQVCIGLGLPISFISIHGCDPTHRQLPVITKADASPGQDAVFYLLDTHRTEIRGRHLIPVTRAWQIAREFLTTGRPPSTVYWEKL